MTPISPTHDIMGTKPPGDRDLRCNLRVMVKPLACEKLPGGLVTRTTPALVPHPTARQQRVLRIKLRK